jgi:hypothetical protein
MDLRGWVGALWLAGCATGQPVTPYDSGGDADTESSSPSSGDSDAPPSTSGDDGAWVGRWVSEGDDVAALFTSSQPAVTRVTARFEASGAYTATVLNSDGDTFTFTGAYTVDDATDPAGIALDQQAPYAASLEGIIAVEGDVLTYDVVDLSLGNPATSGRGFGSSSAGDANIQTYRRR